MLPWEPPPDLREFPFLGEFADYFPTEITGSASCGFLHVGQGSKSKEFVPGFDRVQEGFADPFFGMIGDRFDVLGGKQGAEVRDGWILPEFEYVMYVGTVSVRTQFVTGDCPHCVFSKVLLVN
jgi:hypothetical protein